MSAQHPNFLDHLRREIAIFFNPTPKFDWRPTEKPPKECQVKQLENQEEPQPTSQILFHLPDASSIYGGQKWEGPVGSWPEAIRQKSGPMPPTKKTHFTQEERREIYEKIDTLRELPKSDLERVGMLPGNEQIVSRVQASQPLRPMHLAPIPEEQVSLPPQWINDVRQQTPPQTRTGWLVEQPTIHYWEEFTALATQNTKEGETPTLEVPSVMKQRVEQRYNKESE